MVLNDTLANALSIINQYEKLGKSECVIAPSSRIIADVLGIFKKFGYIKGYDKIKEGKKESFKVKLSGMVNECGVIKPRYSIKKAAFEKWEKRYLPSKDMGILVISTVDGIIDHNKALEKKIGGKLLAYCY
jgi:small subunit ribosomal protein S8